MVIKQRALKHINNGRGWLGRRGVFYRAKTFVEPIFHGQFAISDAFFGNAFVFLRTLLFTAGKYIKGPLCCRDVLVYWLDNINQL